MKEREREREEKVENTYEYNVFLLHLNSLNK